MPKPSTPFAAKIAQDIFGVSATATALPGEYDANYRLDAPDGKRYLLRLSQVGEPREAVEFQNAILAHLAKSNLGVQRVLPALNPPPTPPGGRGVQSLNSRPAEC